MFVHCKQIIPILISSTAYVPIIISVQINTFEKKLFLNVIYDINMI